MENIYGDTLSISKRRKPTQPSTQKVSSSGTAQQPEINLDRRLVDEFQGRRHLRRDNSKKCVPT